MTTNTNTLDSRFHTMCKDCNLRPVHVKKWQSCKKCAARRRWILRSKGISPVHDYELARTIDITKKYKSLTAKRRDKVKRTVKKYGIQFLKDLNALDSRHFWNLTEMGKKYNLSREYIRQIYSLIKQRPYKKVLSKKTEKLKKETELSCTCNPHNQLALAEINGLSKDSHYFKHYKTRKKFMDLCPFADISIDKKGLFIINNHKVNVISAYKVSLTTPRNKTGHFRYSITENIPADFWACWHNEEQAFFIIPRNKINFGKYKTHSIYISKEKSSYYNSKNRYWECRDDWEALVKK